MVFSSQIFLFFFLPLTLLAYFICPAKYRRYLLVPVSLLFFGWTGLKAMAIFVLFGIANFLFGLWLEKAKATQSEKTSRWVLFIVIAANLLFLFGFKYLGMITSTVNTVVEGFKAPGLPVLLGASFFVFGSISYLYDIDSGKIASERNLISFMLYLTFFPKLLQGPITRYAEFKSGISPKVSLEEVSNGVFRFVVGLAKKVIIADQLGVMVDGVFANPATSNLASIAWVGAIGYAMQILFDFAGYTDMAIGLAGILGYKLPENFNFPYAAKNITDFWRRWHMTLGAWFREYVYYPLEFKRRKQKTLRSESNSLIVFLLTGLWHGASWQFVVWGLWHGLFVALEAYLKTKKVKTKAPLAIRYLTTMLIVLVGWVLFRSPSFSYAFQYLGVMFGLVKPEITGVTLGWYLDNKIIFLLILSISLSVPWKQFLPKLYDRIEALNWMSIMRVSYFVLLLLFSLMMVMSSTYSAFIYFKF